MDIPPAVFINDALFLFGPAGITQLLAVRTRIKDLFVLTRKDCFKIKNCTATSDRSDQ